jgi:hypothetical protein
MPIPIRGVDEGFGAAGTGAGPPVAGGATMVTMEAAICEGREAGCHMRAEVDIYLATADDAVYVYRDLMALFRYLGW